MLAGALFGVSAHLGNALRDLDDDAKTGVHGLPHLLGHRVTAIASPVLLVAASLVMIFGATGAGGPEPWRWLAAGVVSLAVGVVVALRQPNSHALFLIVVVVVSLLVLLFRLTGQSLR